MKKTLRLLPVLILIFALTDVLRAQCDSDEFLDKCASNLGTYNYLKTFVSRVNPRKKSSPENIYVFSKGSTYKMIACLDDPLAGKMIISLYDRNHNLIGSTFDESSGKYFSELQYPCPATGVYYIKTSFEGMKSGCGMCILGFSKE
ncbi:MAG TPA: hypothetical protein VK213_01525 [Bacteroidales bacterium]|nr:hypothetical protein [Bacteroidales bacterium]